jgi:hypothetical protein
LKAIFFSVEQAEKRRVKAVMRMNKVFFMVQLFAAKIVFNKKNTLSLRQIKNKASLEIKIENK